MFYASSAHADYWNEKLGIFIALAPVTNLHNTTSGLLKIGADLGRVLGDAADLIGLYTLGQPNFLTGLTGAFCKVPLVDSFCN